MKANLLDRFKGCLVGGAIGDAFGYAVEFMNIEQIREQYGERGITTLPIVDGKALVSDDTQMTLYTANGILCAMTDRKRDKPYRETERYIHTAYMDWMRTQRVVGSRASGGRSAIGRASECSSWLNNVSDMHSVRAPGGTCLRALMSGVLGTMAYPINTSKGCGGMTRIAPVGLYYDPQRYDQKQIDLFGAKCAALTHGHPLGYLSAAALVHIISRVTYGAYDDAGDLYDVARESIHAIDETFGDNEKCRKLTGLLEKAVTLSKEEGGDDSRRIAELGEGWVAEEALAISLYCALKYADRFEDAMIAAVNHNGDSDSTGTITGNILGAWLGYNRIPTSYVEKLELRDVIREMADDLYTDSVASSSAHCQDEKWQKKYVKADYRPA